MWLGSDVSSFSSFWEWIYSIPSTVFPRASYREFHCSTAWMCCVRNIFISIIFIYFWIQMRYLSSVFVYVLGSGRMVLQGCVECFVPSGLGRRRISVSQSPSYGFFCSVSFRLSGTWLIWIYLRWLESSTSSNLFHQYKNIPYQTCFISTRMLFYCNY